MQKIRQLLRERKLAAVNVGTVDDFQGQEARIVFISAVLTRPESLPQAAHTPGAASGECVSCAVTYAFAC